MRQGHSTSVFCAGLLLCLLVLAGSACSGPPVRPRNPAAPAPSLIEERLRATTAQWIGTPYCIGGTGSRCLDCSGFARKVFTSVFATDLPRTAREMRRCGEHLSRGPLAPGDLLLYRISSARLHVGVYLGHGEFAHASSSQGVMISNVRESYWTRRFLEARRII
ncbi:MAG: NlpC/P60 family protein [Candidatus Eisenbacteria bacterium]